VASTPYCQGATLLGMTRREEDEQVMPRHGCVSGLDGNMPL
jgi:hypothetical protein